MYSSHRGEIINRLSESANISADIISKVLDTITVNCIIDILESKKHETIFGTFVVDGHGELKFVIDGNFIKKLNGEIDHSLLKEFS